MFSHLKEVQGLVHHGLWRCALPWAKTHPCHTLHLWRQNTELQKTWAVGNATPCHSWSHSSNTFCFGGYSDPRDTPPEGLSFPYIQKSLSSLTLQHTSAMQRDNQRSFHPFTAQFCMEQAQLLQQYFIFALGYAELHPNSMGQSECYQLHGMEWVHS